MRSGTGVVDLKEAKIEVGNDNLVEISGRLGKEKRKFEQVVSITSNDNKLFVGCIDDSKRTKAIRGTTTAILKQMVNGVTTGFETKVELVGVGYRAQMSGSSITLNLGYSHPITLDELNKKYPNVKTTVVSTNILSVSGTNNEDVGKVVAYICTLRPIEPYKGKGIKILGSFVRRKAGKSGKK